jgi:endonuclease YncB( thermonuclease family)
VSEPAFYFRAKVVRVLDGDTIIVDPGIYKQDEVLRVRFKGVFAPELREDGGEEAKRRAEEMFPAGCEVVLTNTRVRWTYGRLECVVARV